MELCDSDCVAICDFCTRFSVVKRQDVFGICQAEGKIVERSDGSNCEYFRCFRLDLKQEDNKMTENFITLEEAEEEISMDDFWQFDFDYLKNNSDGLVWNNTETGSRIKVCMEKGILTGKAIYGYLQTTEKFLY